LLANSFKTVSVELTDTVFLSFISTFRVPNFEENKHKDMANSLGTRLARIDVLIGGAEQARKQVEQMREEWKKLGKQAQEAQKNMQATVDTVAYDKNKKIYEDALKQQKQLQKSITESERNINTVQKYLTDISGQTLRNLNNAQKGLKQMLLGVNPKDLQTLNTVRDYIKQIADEAQRRKGNLVEFSDIIGDIGNVSDKSLGMAKQRLQELISTTQKNTKEIQTYREQLKKVEDEEQRRISSKAGRVMGNLDGSSVAEIQEAINVTTKLRDAQKLGGQEWEIYNDEIQRAQKYLSDFNNLTKQIAMSDRMKELGKASESSLSELKKYWQEQVNGAQRGSQELAEYESKLKQVLDEEKKRSAKSAVSVFSNLSGSSLTEIQDAIKATTQLRDATELGSKQWDIYNQYIERAKKYLSDFENTSKNAAIAERMKNIGNASTSSLAELKKFWQEQVDGAELSSQKLQQYQQNLEAVIKEEQNRISNRAQTTLGQVQTGTFDGTIAQTKEAIKLLEQYKQQLKTSDTKGVKEVESAINSLNEKLKQSSAEFTSLEDALDKAETVGQGTFDGTYEDLEKLKKSLEEYKKKLEVSDTKGLKKIEDALSTIEKKQKNSVLSAKELDKVLLSLKTASLEDLQKAAAQLQEELSKTERDAEKYVEKSMDLRRVNEQINEVKRSWQEHDNQIVATIKRLTSYVLVYAGFNEVVGRIKQLYQANLQLSDSLADIEKTTGLSTESVAELSREIDSIDTRTAQQELHDLAYEAGKLGISAKEDVLGFVKAGNQLLVALGEDLGGAEAVRQLMKVNAILGETQKLGVEKALLATGSAINEISQTSRASAGPIVDVVNRIGAIGEAAGLSMSDLIALAGTLDALGQHAEMGGTALNTFISTLTSNTTEVAQAVGLSDDYLKNLIEQGKTIQAVIAVFEKMNAMGGLDVLAPIMKDLGSDGERIKQVLVTLSSGVDELKAQVFTSSRAFKEATSVTDEYNIKNENAMAIMQRMGNAIKESFINSGFVEWLTDVLRYISSIPNRFERGEKSIRLMAVTVQALVGVMIATSSAVQKASANIVLFTKMVKAGTASVNIFKIAWQWLSKAMMSNPLGWVVLGFTALTSAITYFKKSVDEATKAQSEFEAAIQKETFELSNLKYAIDKANVSNGERAALIKQLNDKYGAYLGFMVTENNYAEKQEYIYSLINARLRETLALKMRDKMMENIADKYTDQIQELQSKIIASLNKMQNVGETNAGDAMARIMDGMNKVVEEGGNLYDALDGFMEKYNKNIKQLPFSSDALKLMNILKNIRKEAGQTQTFLESTQRAAESKTEELMLQDLRKSNQGILSSSDIPELNTYLQQATTYVQRLRSDVEYLNAKREKGKKLTELETAELERLNERKEKGIMLNKLEESRLEELNDKRRKGENLTDSELKELKEKNRLLGVYQYNIDQVEKRIKAIGLESVWGQGVSLETAGVDKLVATYKKLEAMMKSINEDKDYADTFAARGFKSAKEEYEALKKMEQDVAKVLAEKWGRDTSGNWIKVRKSGTRGEQKEMNDEISAAMSALEAYFLRRQQAIRQAYLEEQITTEEMNRQIDATEEEHLLARVELRKKLLGEENTFNQNLYGMEGKNLESTAALIKKLGERQTDGLRKNLEKDLLEVQNMAVKYRQTIEKELLKYNPFESLVNQFEESLDKLRLLNTDAEKEFRMSLGFSGVIDESAVKERINALVSLSEDAYSLNEDQLRTYLSNIDAVWAESMSPEQMSLMLKKLRDFYQDSKAAAEKYAKDIKEMIDVQWETSGNQKLWEDRIKGTDERTELMGAAGNLGLASTQSSFLGTSETDNAELEALRIRLEAARQYYEEFYARKEELIQQAIASGATQQEAEESYRMAEKEALDELNAAREEQASKELEITESKLSTLKNYTDAVVDFSEQMGEAAFAEVDDRKQAAKMLLQTAMKLTKDLIMQKITELLMKKTLGDQEVAQEAATSATVTAIHGSQAITDMTVEGAKTTGDVTSGIARGSAKTIGDLGWWGIPLIAVISAALSALMGLAMGKLNKAKQDVAAATGVSSSKGRVAAGMLTYAEGDYPVLGNDGQIYNARYQKELKTGVYGGGAHFGIFSEKKPEMIVDGDTTQKLILNYPHIYDSILTIARHGQLKSAAMPTFASGNYPSMPAQITQVASGATDMTMQNEQMTQMLGSVAEALSTLNERLSKPISATVDPYGSKGAVNQLNKASNFMTKRGLIK
jgi:TP901 family phage tail tape measure protein